MKSGPTLAPPTRMEEVVDVDDQGSGPQHRRQRAHLGLAGAGAGPRDALRRHVRHRPPLVPPGQLEHVPPRAVPRRAPSPRRPLPLAAARRKPGRPPAMWKRFDPARPLAVIVGAVVAGVLAGLAASVLLTFTAEPVIDRAVALEESHHHAAEPNEATEPDLVSRSAQKGVGRFAAYGLGGGAYGVLFGIAFLALRRRADAGAFGRAVLAGALMAGAFTVMPFVKYPPNPPGVGDPATLAERQWKYVALIFLSLVVLAGAARLSGRLRQRGWLDEQRLIAVALAVVVPLGVVW